MEIGIVGLPNVGKSSLFNALTAAQVPAENFPFTTIEPNVGIVPVNDSRLDFLQALFKAPKRVAASIRFVDIAGLVPGASQGAGLGNKFLAHIREVDSIAQIVRCFDNKDVVNVLGELNPEKDADIISTELLLSDLEVADKLLEKFQGAARSGQEEARKKIGVLEKVKQKIEAGAPLREQNWPPDDIKEFNFLTAKPVLYVANTGENSEPYIAKLKNWVEAKKAPWLSLNAKLEADIMGLPEGERLAYREAMGVMESGLDLLGQAGQKLLNLITFFAAGPKEVHAWHVTAGDSIVKAAGKIHSDMEKGFIRAEVYSVQDLKALRSEAQLREVGKIRTEGKEYIVQDGDVVHILFKV